MLREGAKKTMSNIPLACSFSHEGTAENHMGALTTQHNAQQQYKIIRNNVILENLL